MANQYTGEKLNAEQKQKAYESLCEHIGNGFSQDAWHYEDESDKNLTITFRTMYNYMKNEPEAFLPSKMQVAEAKSRRFFEDIGIRMMLGQIDKCQPAIFQIFMRNKFGWDKKQEYINPDHDNTVQTIDYSSYSEEDECQK